eukprot:gene50457-42714_t
MRELQLQLQSQLSERGGCIAFSNLAPPFSELGKGSF